MYDPKQYRTQWCFAKMTDNKLVISLSEDLKERVVTFSEDNEISQSGAVRMILNRKLPEIEETA